MVIVLSVLSQITDIIILGQLNSLFWIGLTILCFERTLSSPTKEYIFWFSLLFLYLCLMFIVDYYLQFPSTLRLLITPLIVIYVADCFSTNGTDDIEIYTCVYLISTVILATHLNISTEKTVNEWIESQEYLIVQKNSASQIFASAIIASFFFIKNNGIFKRVAKYTGIIYLFFSMLLLQSRTSFFALAVAVLCYSSKTKKNKRTFFIVLLCIACLIALLMNRSFIEFISHALLFDKYEDRSFDDYSSGRMHAIEEGLQLFYNHPAFGVGYYYVDCFYVNILVNIGLTGGIIVFTLLGRRLYQCFTYKGKENEELFLKCITVFYICESIGEAAPPFGPGVACFMFWFISTIILKGDHKENLRLQNETIV